MSSDKTFSVVILGGGAGGIAVAASLLKRDPNLKIAIVEPSAFHYYQPGWTLVGGGVFQPQQTRRKTADLIPSNATWYQAQALSIDPDQHKVNLSDQQKIEYEQLVVATGLELRWDKIEGLSGYLGSEGITSNYAFEHAPYTYELIQGLRKGRAIFTQPSMPIKCAGAPQKAMYLACSYWKQSGVLDDIEVEFCNAGEVLFGVRDYLPALFDYVDQYGIQLHNQCNLVGVDPLNKIAYFDQKQDDGASKRIEKPFDILHLCPPQAPSDLIEKSRLANPAGWLDVDPISLQHTKYSDVFGIGDIMGTPNAKTAAAVRKQAPVVASNLFYHRAKQPLQAKYKGYGSCPLTVEHGKIVLAEFGYQGALQPTFPSWILNGKNPSRMAWLLKTQVLPKVYWHLMLKGREWLTG